MPDLREENTPIVESIKHFHARFVHNSYDFFSLEIWWAVFVWPPSSPKANESIVVRSADFQETCICFVRQKGEIVKHFLWFWRNFPHSALPTFEFNYESLHIDVREIWQSLRQFNPTRLSGQICHLIIWSGRITVHNFHLIRRNHPELLVVKCIRSNWQRKEGSEHEHCVNIFGIGGNVCLLIWSCSVQEAILFNNSTHAKQLFVYIQIYSYIYSADVVFRIHNSEEQNSI